MYMFMYNYISPVGDNLGTYTYMYIYICIYINVHL
jgi:hypothetical protein